MSDLGDVASRSTSRKAGYRRCRAVGSKPSPDLVTVPRAELEAIRDAMKVMRDYGCPVCSGDCGSANPFVSACPMQVLSSALTKLEAHLKGEP